MMEKMKGALHDRLFVSMPRERKNSYVKHVTVTKIIVCYDFLSTFHVEVSLYCVVYSYSIDVIKYDKYHTNTYVQE